MNKWIITVFLTFWSLPAHLQNLKFLEDSLAKLSGQFITDTNPKLRQEAFSHFTSLMHFVIPIKGSFDYSFDSLKGVSILYPPDSSFRIFTAQTQIGRDLYRHFGALQWANEKKRPVIFQDQSENIQNYESAILNPANWYGALYYNLIAFESGYENRYLLFGYDSYSRFHKWKMIDVLCIGEDSLFFGAPVFDWEDRILTRFVWQYSADVQVHLNFDVGLDMIIFDNLIPMKGPYTGQGVVMVPDGSYRGFKMKKGIWIAVEKIFFEVQTKPPGDSPVLDQESEKDLFGRPRKG